MVYRKGSMTAPRAIAIGNSRHDRLELIEVPRSESHCALPVARLPGLLRSLGNIAAHAEVEDEEEAITSDWPEGEDASSLCRWTRGRYDRSQRPRSMKPIRPGLTKLTSSWEAQALDESADETDFEATGVDPYELGPGESESPRTRRTQRPKWVEDYDEAALHAG